MRKITFKDLAKWRPIFPGQKVRTKLKGGEWILERTWEGKTIYSEKLEASRFARPLKIAVLELEALNIGSPELAFLGVAPDTSGFWSVRVGCEDCGGFSWRLPLIYRYVRGLRGQWEREMARLLGRRAEIVFSSQECPGCFDLRLEKGEMNNETFYWYSTRHQDWHLRAAVGESHLDLPLNLPSWAKQEEVYRSVDKLLLQVREHPFNWEKE